MSNSDLISKINTVAQGVEIAETLIPIHSAKIQNLANKVQALKPILDTLGTSFNIPELSALLGAVEGIVAHLPASSK
jgi:hypothetical protein